MPASPNVLVILTDQLRAFEVGCYGNPVARTPALDRLAASGVRFATAVTNNPVCTPARSSLLTGQYGRTCTGELGNVSDDPPCPRRRRLVDPTLADCFRAAGYRTSLIGKWHIDPSPLACGFHDALYPLTIHRYAQQTYIENDDRWCTVGPYAPDFEADRACAYLAEPHDRPFFLFYNISLPHNPIGAAELPAEYATRFDREAIPLRPNVAQDGALPHSERWFKVMTIWDYFWRLWGPCWNAAPECGYPERVGELPSDALPEGFDLRSLAALYYGATAWADALVDRVLAALEASGQADNTIVLFLSDHGDNLGSHHLFNKDVLYEEAIRIPYLLRAPGVAAGVAQTQIAQIIDAAPTLLDLCGLPAPATMQGRSLAPVLRGDCDALPDNLAFIETDPSQFGCPTIGVRTPDALLGMTLSEDGRAIADPERWYYRLDNDPYQQHNLAGSPAHRAEIATLQARLRAWHEGTAWLEVGE
jgi:choline-sulfatase